MAVSRRGDVDGADMPKGALAGGHSGCRTQRKRAIVMDARIRSIEDGLGGIVSEH